MSRELSLKSEQPLSPAMVLAARVALFAAIVVFYFLVAGFAFWAGVWLFCVVLTYPFVMIYTERGTALGLLERTWEYLKTLALAVWSAPQPHLSIPLREEDAPELFEGVRAIAGRVGAEMPTVIEIVPERTAYAVLPGYGRGGGKFRLGLGFELLCVLDRDETSAVIAHELGHAVRVQRGFRGITGAALGRMLDMVGSLQTDIAESKQRGRRPIHPQMLLAPALGLTSAAHRAFAACSRHDEFEADELAVQCAGAEVTARALLRTVCSGFADIEPGSRELRVTIERARSCVKWLREVLSPGSPEVATAWVGRALSEERRSAFNTHPTLSDRLDHIFEGIVPRPDPSALILTQAGPPGATFLRDPEAISRRIFDLFAELRTRSERDLTDRAQTELRRTYRAPHPEVFWSVATLLTLLCLALLSKGAFRPLIFVAAFAAQVIGRWWALRHRHADRLPAPTAASWWELYERDRAWEFAGWEAPDFDSDPRFHSPAQLPASQTEADYWNSRMQEAIEQGQIPVAVGYSLKLLDVDPKHPHGLGVAAVGATYGDTEELLKHVMGGLEGHLGHTSTPWFIGWMALAQRDWPAAAFLIRHAAEHHPSVPVLWAGVAQARHELGLHWISLEAADRIVELEPDQPLGYLWRLRGYLALGMVAAAEGAISDLRRLEADVSELVLAEARVAFLRDDDDRGEALLDQLNCAADPKGSHFLDSADACAAEDRYPLSRKYLDALLELGHSPAAHLRYAALCARATDVSGAFAHLEAALNAERTPRDGPSGLDLAEPLMTIWYHLGEQSDSALPFVAEMKFNPPIHRVKTLRCQALARTEAEARAQFDRVLAFIFPSRLGTLGGIKIRRASGEERPLGSARIGPYCLQTEMEQPPNGAPDGEVRENARATAPRAQGAPEPTAEDARAQGRAAAENDPATGSFG